MRTFSLGLLVLNMLSLAALANERDAIQSSAGAITANIRRAQFERVGVLPVLFEEDQRNQFANDAPQQPVLRASLQGRLYAEMLESQLAENSNGAYRLIDSGRIFEALKRQTPDLSKLSSGSRDLQQLATAVEGLQALVVGTVRERMLSDQSPLSVRDLSWKLIDLKDGSIVTGNSKTSYFSLANAVYEGRSQEYFRWQNGRLYAIGFGWLLPPLNDMPLKPDDSLDLYRLSPNETNQPHPIVSPKCPFKVNFLVNGKPRGVQVPVDKEIGNVNRHETKEQMGQRMRDDAAYLAIDPGDSLTIQARNTSSKDALVGVFVDGINILGKRRELPDDKCRVWSLTAGTGGSFKGWYSGQKGMEQLEEFVVTPWADSIAGQMGEKEHVGAITLVFFNAGWPNRNVLARYPRTYEFNGWWDPRERRFQVTDGMVPEGVAGSAADMFAMGAKKPQAGALNYNASEPQGTILCSMTVWYGPKAGLLEIAKNRAAKKGFVDDDSFVLVEERTESVGLK